MLKEDIQKDLISALKNKNEFLVSVLRMLNSALKNRELEKRRKLGKIENNQKELERLSKLTDQEVIEVISFEVKKRKEAAEQYKVSNRKDLAEKEEKEIKALKKYLPEEFSEKELRELIDKEIKIIKISSLKDFPKLMKVIMPKVKGRADGALVAKLARERLQKIES